MDRTLLDDAAIIDLYWARSEEAIAATDRKYGPYCRAIALRILRDSRDGEECVSDTWLKAWEAMPPQRPRLLQAFLGRITRNLALNRYKAEHTSKRGGGELAAALEELDEVLPSPATVEDALDARELSALIDRFLGELSAEARAVFVRRYWYLCPVGEIAAETGMSRSAVKMSLLRTRNKLKARLIEEGHICE